MATMALVCLGSMPAAKLRTGSVSGHDKLILLESAPSWRRLVSFSWTVFPGGSGPRFHPAPDGFRDLPAPLRVLSPRLRLSDFAAAGTVRPAGGP